MASSVPQYALWAPAAKHISTVNPALAKQLLQTNPLKNPQLVAKISALIASLPSVKALQLNPSQLGKFSQAVWHHMKTTNVLKAAFSAFFRSVL